MSQNNDNIVRLKRREPCPFCHRGRSHAEQQADFMDMCKQKRFLLKYLIKDGGLNHPEFLYWLALWSRLINEEVNFELQGSVREIIANPYSKKSKTEEGRLAMIVALADDIIDSKYVIDGMANTLGLPLEKLFTEVHRSNMSKGIMQEDGTYKIERREDGKTLKPKAWKAPDLSKIIEMEYKEAKDEKP